MTEKRRLTRRIHNDTIRNDGWYNLATGIGTSADKTTMGAFRCFSPLRDSELSELYHFDPISGRIVDDRVNEMFKVGYTIELVDGKGSPQALQKLQAKSIALGLSSKFEECTRLARIYGGAALVCFPADGRALSEPYIPGKGRGLLGALVLDKRSISVNQYYGLDAGTMDPAKIGTPEFFNVASANGIVQRVHESRVIPFFGAYTDPFMRRNLGGWGLSVMQRPYEVLKMFMQAFQMTGGLLADMSQAVFKMKNLWEMINQNQKKQLLQRMALVDRARSSIKALVIDSEEEFERKVTPMTGVPETLTQFMLLFGASIDMPLTKLFGRSPEGMNATGDSDTRNWYDAIMAEQSQKVNPLLLRALGMVGAEFKIPQEDIEVCWTPLYSPTDKESAETDYVRAQTTNIEIQNGMLDPLEARLAKYGNMPIDQTIDVQATLKELQTGEVEGAAESAPQLPEAPPEEEEDDSGTSDD